MDYKSHSLARDYVAFSIAGYALSRVLWAPRVFRSLRA